MKAFIFAAVFATASLFAQVTAYINMETVFEQYYKTITENIKFEESHQKFNDGILILRNEFDNTHKEYMQAVTDAKNDLLGDSARQAAVQKAQMLEVRLQQKQEELLQYRQEAMREIENNQQMATEAIVKDLQAQLTKYAADKKIDVVLEVSGKTMNRMPVVLVYPKDQEITEAFVKLTNAGHEKEKAEAQAKLDAMHAAAEEWAKKNQAK